MDNDKKKELVSTTTSIVKTVAIPVSGALMSASLPIMLGGIAVIAVAGVIFEEITKEK